MKTRFLELQQRHGTIQIKCKGADELPFDVIKNFQGKLKKLSQENAIRLATSLFINGFCAPFFIWENGGERWCIDGHQRATVLNSMREAGIILPNLFPVCFIDAENEADARQKLLTITSQYGEFQKDQLDEWMSKIDEEIREMFRLTDKEIAISVDVDNKESEEIEYKNKIEIIIEVDSNNVEKLFNEFTNRGLKCKISTL